MRSARFFGLFLKLFANLVIAAISVLAEFVAEIGQTDNLTKLLGLGQNLLG